MDERTLPEPSNIETREVGTQGRGCYLETKDVERIARIAHEANRAYCDSIGDDSQREWKYASNSQRASAMSGVDAITSGQVKKPSDSHYSWLNQKQADGWVYGPVKDEAAKTHPCMVEYAELPPHQRRKDHLFLAIVRALTEEV